jgi:hypothetical protein
LGLRPTKQEPGVKKERHCSDLNAAPLRRGHLLLLYKESSKERDFFELDEFCDGVNIDIKFSLSLFMATSETPSFVRGKKLTLLIIWWNSVLWSIDN